MTEFVVTDFEWNGQVYVPAGDGAPAQWKPMRDLTVGEFARHTQGRQEAVDLQMERTKRYEALIDEVKRRGCRGPMPVASVLSREEMAELKTLKMTLDAMEREQDRRQAAIDKDMAAGRCRVWLTTDDGRGSGAPCAPRR